MLVPFLWMANRSLGLRRSAASTVLAALPGIAAFVLIRVAPPIPPGNGLSLFEDVVQNLSLFRDNFSGLGLRYFVTPWLTLGLLPFLALADWRRCWGLVQLRIEVPVYLASVLGVALIGGGDYDRFALWLSPVVLVLAARSVGALFLSRVALVAISVAHAVSTRSFQAWGTSEHEYRESVVALMSTDAAFSLGLLVLTCAVVCAIPLFWTTTRSPTRRPLGPSAR